MNKELKQKALEEFDNEFVEKWAYKHLLGSLTLLCKDELKDFISNLIDQVVENCKENVSQKDWEEQ